MNISSPTNIAPPHVVDVDVMDTKNSPSSVGVEGGPVNLCPLEDHDYIWDDVCARIDPVRDTATSYAKSTLAT